MLKVLELFGGIGAPKKALVNLNIPHEIIDYVEKDLVATEAYNLIHNTNYRPLDIRKYKPNINEEIDLVFHGSPCQSFSVAGKNEGGEKGSGTESSLLWETIRIIKGYKKRPKIIIWENVKGATYKKHKPVLLNYIEDLNQLGYKSVFKVLNSSDFGIPQNRERVFVISIHGDYEKDYGHFSFDNLRKRDMKPLKEFLEKKVGSRYSIKQISMIKAIRDKKIKIINGIVQTITTKQMRWNNPGVLKMPFSTFNQENYIFLPEETKTKINTITARGANAKLKIALPIKEYSNFLTPTKSFDGVPKRKIDYSKIEKLPVFLIDNKHYNVRTLTPKEAITLMGFEEKDYDKIKHLSDSKIYKVAGNSIVVQVIEAIFENLFNGPKGSQNKKTLDIQGTLW